MTTLEKIIEQVVAEHDKFYGNVDCDEWQEGEHYAYHRVLQMYADAKAEQQPCEDAISRQAVYEILEGNWNTDFLHAEVEKMPSVQPKRKMGVWITEICNNKEHYSCSNCLHIVDYEPCYHYCPNCGAKMVEPQESEDEECSR